MYTASIPAIIFWLGFFVFDDGLFVRVRTAPYPRLRRRSLAAGCLALDALDQTIGDPAVEPAQDAVPMALDGARSVDDRLSRPCVAQKCHRL